MISADLTGKRVLVTGGASGIGLASAELFAASGARVVINDLAGNPELNVQAERLRNEGFQVYTEAADMGKPEEVKAMVANAVTRLEGLDYLINNAGTPATRSPIPAQDLEQQSEAFWQKIMSVNLMGAFHCTAAAISHLQESHGAIVNTASIAGIVGAGSSSAYSASKAALINLTREHGRVFGPNVRVNAVAPGLVESNWECTFSKAGAVARNIPLKRIGLPQDYAETIFFLCAGAAYITGQTIIVDGGLTLGRP